MNTIESKLAELENMEYELTELVPDESATVNGGSANGVILMYAEEVNSVLEQYGAQEAKLIQALREAVSALNYVADYENVGRSVYSDTDPERARQSLTNIEKILNGGK